MLFFLAVSITRNGVWGEHRNRMLVPHADWLRRSIKQTSGAYGFCHRVRLAPWEPSAARWGNIVEAMPAVILGGLALIVFWFLAVEAEEEQRQ